VSPTRDQTVFGAFAGNAVDGVVDELLKGLEVTLYSRFFTERYERQNNHHSLRSFFFGKSFISNS
jgi:hypothetical protein